MNYREFEKPRHSKPRKKRCLYSIRGVVMFYWVSLVTSLVTCFR